MTDHQVIAIMAMMLRVQDPHMDAHAACEKAFWTLYEAKQWGT